MSVDGGVADVRLNRPDQLNAFDLGMFTALIDAGEALKADPAVRAVVLSGEGRAFCSGLDFSVFLAMGDDEAGADPDNDLRPLAGRGDGVANSGQRSVHVWRELPVPVIAAVHGYALGAGCQLALGADIRIVAPDATLSVLEIRWGLVPDMTGTQVLPGLVGLDVAKELTFTGRMVSGDEAVRIGLATRTADDPRGAARALAAEIAAKSPDAIRGAKALLDLAGTVPLREGLIAEEQTMAALIGAPNNVEAVTAYFAKRPAAFVDPAPPS